VGLAAVGVALSLRGPARWYALVPVASFIAFCAALKWQPWHSRLHMPIMALVVPIGGLMLGRAWMRWLVALPAMSLAVYSVLSSETRPILGEWCIFRRDRDALMYVQRRGLLAPSADAAARAAALRPNAIGAHTGASAPLYALLRQCRSACPGVPTIHMQWGTPRHGERRGVDPEVLIATDQPYDAILDGETGTIYRLHQNIPPFRIFVTEAKLRALSNELGGSRR